MNAQEETTNQTTQRCPGCGCQFLCHDDGTLDALLCPDCRGTTRPPWLDTTDYNENPPL